jgi:hypothetical protein
VNLHLPPRLEPVAQRVGVEVAEQQGGLEEDHAGVPDRRRPPEQGEDHLADHRLDEEQEERADE